MLGKISSRFGAPALVVSALAIQSPQATAGDWRGHYGTPYAAYKAGGPFDDDRRALDGSYRTPTPLAMPGTWTGLYFGGTLGGSTGGFETSQLASADIDIGSFSGGVHAGYAMQLGRFVGALEIDGTWLSDGGGETTTGAYRVSASTDWLSSARARLGYTFDQYMVYATGGVALGSIDASITGPGFETDLSETMVGYAVGGGVEMKLTETWSARVEALHYGFGEEELSSSAGTLGIDADVTTIRAGISLKLN